MRPLRLLFLQVQLVKLIDNDERQGYPEHLENALWYIVVLSFQSIAEITQERLFLIKGVVNGLQLELIYFVWTVILGMLYVMIDGALGTLPVPTRDADTHWAFWVIRKVGGVIVQARLRVPVPKLPVLSEARWSLVLNFFKAILVVLLVPS